MRRIPSIFLLAATALSFAAGGAGAQQRRVAPGVGVSSLAQASVDIPSWNSGELVGWSVPEPELDQGSNSSWWARHPSWTGAITGAAAGLVGYRAYESRDSYCQDPDMFTCDVAIPIFVFGGAVLGAGIVAAIRAL